MRSVLTALGIIIGVGAVIAMVGIGKRRRKAQVEAQIASLGGKCDSDFFRGSTTSKRNSHRLGAARATLKIEDAEAIPARSAPALLGVSEESRFKPRRVAAGKSKLVHSHFSGESADYFDIRQWPTAGRRAVLPRRTCAAREQGMRHRAHNRDAEFTATKTRSGQILRISKNVPFTITGVAHAQKD